MRTLIAVLLVGALVFLTACTGSGSSLSEEQRDRRAEELIEGDLSD